VPADSGMGAVIGIPTDSLQFPNAWISASESAKDGTPYMVKERTAHLRITCQQADVVLSDPALKSMPPGLREFLTKECI